MPIFAPMKAGSEKLILVFTELGKRLGTFGQDVRSRAAIAQATADNGWFTHGDITLAVDNVRRTMLSDDALREWTAAYPIIHEPKDIGVIMAGNIPLVGFFDLLCVLVSGHRLHYKASSKDTAMMEYVVSLLKEIDPRLPIHKLAGQTVDAVIATGSDNTNRYFRSLYGSIPAVFRGSRSSVAVLDGSESDEELARLANDIFTYSGLGCRNVSHLLLPPGHDFVKLMGILDQWLGVNAKYINNFRQRSSMLGVDGIRHTKGRFYILREDTGFPSYISEITWQTMPDTLRVKQWLADNDSRIQCVVGNSTRPRRVQFGASQSPGLTDYPDAVDVMRFLSSL